MQPSDSFRARRPPSPHKLALTHPPPPPQPRFPQHRTGDYVGADEKLDAVRQDVAGRPVLTRKLHTGGLRKMTPGEWKLLIVIALIACAVRLFRLSKPNSVVYVTGTRRRGNGGLRYYHLVSTRYTLESLLENISRYEPAVQVPNCVCSSVYGIFHTSHGIDSSSWIPDTILCRCTSTSCEIAVNFGRVCWRF